MAMVLATPISEHWRLPPDAPNDFSFPIWPHPKPSKLQDVFESSPEELVDRALKTLQDVGIQLVEWRALLHRRMGVPAMITDYHFLVPDEELEVASTLLLDDVRLPQSIPPPLHLKTGGDFYEKGKFFRLTRSTHVGVSQHLVLYPASFAAYDPADLIPLPRSSEVAQSRCPTILVPAPHAVYTSMLRMMRAYPRFSPTRKTLESELSELIGYHLYGLHGGYIDTDDDELCEELEVDQSIERGVNTVEEWRKSGQLGSADESWIGDILADVVAGRRDIEDIPWTPVP